MKNMILRYSWQPCFSHCKKLEKFLSNLMDESNSLIDDGTIAQDESQSMLLWKLRESVSESLQRDGVVYKYDISLPLSHFYKIVEDMR